MATRELEFDRNDHGKGSINHYRGVLVPANTKVRLTLAGSNSYQEALREIVDSGMLPIETATGKRTQADEGIDAPIPVRLFLGSRVSGVVGYVPSGLESVYDEALGRLDTQGKKARIPVEIIHKRGLYRVDLLVGLTR